ncbi:hypothetical protein Scep_021698 [Stephania cephalantha]|uniref:Uncharacterized protein n=1 Tax=Stephania cephalantha TaxID=152367 RepID=A0AAP0F4T5_9MAGN
MSEDGDRWGRSRGDDEGDESIGADPIEGLGMRMVKRSAQLNSWRKNTQNGVFTCNDRMPDSLPRVTRCAVGRIGDNSLALNMYAGNHAMDSSYPHNYGRFEDSHYYNVNECAVCAAVVRCRRSRLAVSAVSAAVGAASPTPLLEPTRRPAIRARVQAASQPPPLLPSRRPAIRAGVQAASQPPPPLVPNLPPP